ncbi:MAG: YggS family pyridoxal phosphate-dependent enzyme [Acidiferrobacteraceae bacterium]
MPTSSYICERLDSIHAEIEAAAHAAGRLVQEIRLIAVSKQQSALRVREACIAGQMRFGENFVQEALPKMDALSDAGIEWHFTGSLQSNKAKWLPGRFAWVHSLASMTAARRLSDAARAAGVRVSVLLEVNLARESTKQGVAPDVLPRFLEELLSADLGGLDYRGLMTIGPRADMDARTRAFAGLRELASRLRAAYGLSAFSELSMGMTEDFIPAIREGATFVRIGRGIFGDRSSQGGEREAT